MIKGSEHREIEILGRMQAALRILEDAAPGHLGTREVLLEGKRLLRKSMLAQWEITTNFVSADDT